MPNQHEQDPGPAEDQAVVSGPGGDVEQEAPEQGTEQARAVMPSPGALAGLTMPAVPRADPAAGRDSD